MPIKSKYGHWLSPVEAKTADYTIRVSDLGKTFTNKGASGTVILTTPKPAPELNGAWFRVVGAANQTLTVTSGTVDKLVVFNDIAADTWSLATSGAIIGSGATVLCDGALWIVMPHNAGTDAATPVVARNTLTT